MPIRSSVTGGAPAPAAGYPKLLQGPSGTVWLATGPSPKKVGRSTGVVVHLSSRPQKAKHHVGYTAAILNETDMRPFTGEVRLSA